MQNINGGKRLQRIIRLFICLLCPNMEPITLVNAPCLVGLINLRIDICSEKDLDEPKTILPLKWCSFAVNVNVDCEF